MSDQEYPDNKIMRLMIAIWAIAVLIAIAILVGGGYVVYHFLMKVW